MKYAPENSHDQASLSVWLAVAYVLTPVILFLLQWITLPLGLIAASLLIWSVATPLQRARNGALDTSKLLFVFTALLISAIWVLLSGISGSFYANAYDWIIRFALARDLAVMATPVTYWFEGQTYLLRAALGYFLVPSELAHLFGPALLQSILFAWTLAGVALFFILAFGSLSIRLAVTSCAMFIFCSGLDYYGILLFSSQPPAMGSHLEWWAGNLQYSSNTTLLFWVPNHAVAAWIATALLYRFGTQLWFKQITPALAVALLLWSPLSGAGFMLLWLVTVLPLPVKAILPMWRQMALALPAMAIVLLYLTEGMGSISAEGPMARASSLNFIARVTLFDAVEFLVFLPFIVMTGNMKRAFPAIFCLAVLPFFSFGPSNDLVLRASIPALTYYWLVLIAAANQNSVKLKLHTRVAVFLLPFSIGAMNPFFEVSRALMSTAWSADLSQNLPAAFIQQGATNPFPPHYFTLLNDGALRSILKKAESE